MNVLIFEKNDIHADATALLTSAGHTVIDPELKKYDPDSVEAVFIRTYTQVNLAFLNTFPNLKYVIRAGAGLDNIDLEECQKHGIQAFNSPGTNAHSVAELAIGFTIFLMRNVHAQIHSLKNDTWRLREHLGSDVAGKTIGVLGCGAVGKLVAKKLSGFDIGQVLGYDPFLSQEQLATAGITKAELTEILTRSDVIILSIPLTPNTNNLITLARMKMMKKTSYLINVSRGGIVNEKDLIEALNTNIIAGAALDVFENEPHGINPNLVTNDNLIATPHIGGFTVESDRAICTAAAANFLSSFSN
jgi:D-3-phosphoglycerate dehydrogenase